MPLGTTRASLLSDAASNQYDVVVVGGGITGACAAWDAATRGLRVLILERADFGAATSAHSLKILHGGIRYLQHLDFRRLRESCKERSTFLRMAPHLTSPKPFIVPTYGYGLQGKNVFRAAFALLRLVTADRNREISDDSQKIPNGYTISRDEVLRRFPDINASRLTGAAVFHDGFLLNPPRLVFEIVRTAMEAGATALNYCRAVRIKTDDQAHSVSAIQAEDVTSGKSYEFRARTVINAAGPYAPWLASADHSRDLQPPLSRDMAFVVSRLSDDPAALAVQTRYKDPDAILTRGNRHLFMVPWRNYTLIGVHSRVFRDHPDTLEVTESEIAEFLDEINEACPGLDLAREDIHAVNAGLLPFGDNEDGADDLSFGKRSLVRDHGRDGGLRGLVTAISVRWTMGRATAEAAVNSIERQIRGETGECRTSSLSIRGTDFTSKTALLKQINDDDLFNALTREQADAVATHLGSNWTVLKRIVLTNPDMAKPLPGTSTLRGQILIAARDEMAASLADIVLRRTDIGSGKLPPDDVLAECALIAARELEWSVARTQAEIDTVKSLYPFYGSTVAAPQYRDGG